MVPDNPCESYAMLVRESMQFDIPTPSRRIEIIRELPQPAVFNAVHIITGAFAIIFYYDPVMAGIALLSAPVTVIFSRKFMICYKTASRVMIFSISTSLTIVCNQCKTPCSTILLRNTGGNIPTLVTMAATSSLTKCKNAPIGRDSASA